MASRIYMNMIDYAVWWQLMAISLGIGIYIKVNYKRRGHIILNPVDDFYLADSELGILPVALSVIASFITAIALMNLPESFFISGITSLTEAGGFLLAVIPCAFLFAPLYEKLPIITVYEYISWRFDNRVRLVAVAFFMIRMLLYLSNALIVPVLTFRKLLNGNHWLLMVVTVSLAVVFTALGGMRAVVWSNLFQLLLTLSVPIMVISAVLLTNDTITDIFRASYYTNRFHIVLGFDMDEQYSVLSTVTRYTIVYLGIYGTNQVVIQQLLSLKYKKNIKITMVVATIGYSLIYIPIFSICVILSFYYMACDPVKNNVVDSYYYLLSQYIFEKFLLYNAYAGCAMAALFGTTLSTISPAILTMATVTLNDAILIYRKDLSPEQKVILMQLFILLYGVVMVGSGILMAHSKFLLSLSLNNLTALSASHLTLLIMAWCLPFVNSYGAISGFLVNNLVCNFLHLISYKFKNTYKTRPSTVGDCKITDAWIANQTDIPAKHSDSHILLRATSGWDGMIGLFLGISVGCIVSAFTNKRVDIKDRKIDSRLISPLVHKWFKSYLKFSEDAYVRPEESETNPDTTKSKRRKSYKPETKEEIIH